MLKKKAILNQYPLTCGRAIAKEKWEGEEEHYEKEIFGHRLLHHSGATLLGVHWESITCQCMSASHFRTFGGIWITQLLFRPTKTVNKPSMSPVACRT